MSNESDHGFMRPPKGLDERQIHDIERFAHKVGIGPLFDLRRRHRGQHGWGCTECVEYKAKRPLRAQPPARQPWESQGLFAGRIVGHGDDWMIHGYYAGSHVYFIQPVDAPDAPVKIGIAKHPPARLKALQTGYPETLTILHSVPGGRNLERCLHEVFKDARTHGEWFVGKDVPVILGLADDLCELMRSRADGTKEGPKVPTLHELHVMAIAVRRRLSSERMAA